jgi:hypothetical protein
MVSMVHQGTGFCVRDRDGHIVNHRHRTIYNAYVPVRKIVIEEEDGFEEVSEQPTHIRVNEGKVIPINHVNLTKNRYLKVKYKYSVGYEDIKGIN